MLQLPENVQSRVDAMYKRDVAQFAGQQAAGKMENEYESFLAELGGGPPPGMGGAPAGPSRALARAAARRDPIDPSLY